MIVGKKTEGDESTVVTTNPHVDDPKKVTIGMPSPNAPIRALLRDGPKWALYMKGTVSIFALLVKTPRICTFLCFLGVIANYVGNIPPAFKAVVHTSVPTGGGLSSSAALEVATYMFLDQLTGPNSVMQVLLYK